MTRPNDNSPALSDVSGTQKTLNRREAITGAAAMAAATIVPMPAFAAASSEFATMQERFTEALSLFRAARQHAFETREQIFEIMRMSDNPIRGYFGSPQIRQRATTRCAVRARAEELFLADAVSDADRDLQRQARRIYDGELGGTSFPPASCRAREVRWNEAVRRAIV